MFPCYLATKKNFNLDNHVMPRLDQKQFIVDYTKLLCSWVKVIEAPSTELQCVALDNIYNKYTTQHREFLFVLTKQSHVATYAGFLSAFFYLNKFVVHL